MSNRPSLARKVTPGSEKKRIDELDQGCRLVIDGVAYEARVGDLTPPLARELRQATGGSFQRLIAELALDPDIDSVAALIWLSRRISGERVELDDVMVTYQQILSDGFVVESPEGNKDAEGSEDFPEA